MEFSCVSYMYIFFFLSFFFFFFFHMREFVFPRLNVFTEASTHTNVFALDVSEDAGT